MSKQTDFIEEIAPCAQKAYKVLGKVKPSVCIAMACVESGYGSSSIMRRHNAYLGQKVGTGKTATKYWGGKFFTTRTSEEYTLGVHTVIKAAFRAYDSMEQCVFNYYELLNTKLYSRVLATSDYATQMKQIKAVGYMTSSTEVNSVLKIINTYGLTKYDGEEQSKSTDVKKKSIDEIAQEVIHAKWGNGMDRKKRLEAAGYNYAEVQAKVNELLHRK